MKKCIVLAVASLVIACGNGAAPPPASVTPTPVICTAKKPETYAVLPFSNKTKAKLELGGADSLLSARFVGSGCFDVIERERLEVLLSEMKLCSDANPDREYMDCASFAQKGRLLGIKRFVFPDVIFFEPDIAGAQLKIQIPGLPAGIDASQKYSAMSLSVRIVDTETGRQIANTVEHAVLSEQRAGVGGAVGPLDVKSSIYSKSPFGLELDDMLARVTKRIAAAD